MARHQRRASRIAFHYLRDAAEADEAVQDAFVKAYSHLASFREALPFEVWFTRILINGCLDRIKARRAGSAGSCRSKGRRRERGIAARVARTVARGSAPRRERRTLVAGAGEAARTAAAVFMLSQYEGARREKSARSRA